MNLEVFLLSKSNVKKTIHDTLSTEENADLFIEYTGTCLKLCLHNRTTEHNLLVPIGLGSPGLPWTIIS